MQQTVPTTGVRRGPQLRLPMQTAPVDRSTSAGTLNATAGVDADGWFDDIVGVVKHIAPAVGPVLGALGV